MTVILNDPSWLLLFTWSLFSSYLSVAADVIVVYDWVLTLAQEIELIWRQRWSPITVLYLVIRYIGVLYSVITIMLCMSLISLTDAGCNILNYAIMWTIVIVAALWDVVMIARLHAMYHRSRMMLIFLVVIFLVVNIACGVFAAIGLKHTVGEELIFPGTYMCSYGYRGDARFLISMVWILNTVWEVLALCLSVWIAVEHFRDLRHSVN